MLINTVQIPMKRKIGGVETKKETKKEKDERERRREALKDPNRVWDQEVTKRYPPLPTSTAGTAWNRIIDLADYVKASPKTQYAPTENDIARRIVIFGLLGVEEDIGGVPRSIRNELLEALGVGWWENNNENFPADEEILAIRYTIMHGFWDLIDSTKYVIGSFGPPGTSHYHHQQMEDIQNAITGNFWIDKSGRDHSVISELTQLIDPIEKLVHEKQPRVKLAVERAVAAGWRSEATLDNVKHYHQVWRDMLAALIILRQTLGEILDKIGSNANPSSTTKAPQQPQPTITGFSNLIAFDPSLLHSIPHILGQCL
jgi:hypothetical protein